MDIVLASSSPRRRELLAHITDNFRVLVSDADENIDTSLPPDEYTAELALKKARAVAELEPDAAVIGSDTVVVCDGEIMGKPKDADDAKRMLARLQGRGHTVITAVHIVSPKGERSFVSSTEVHFAPMTEREICEYVATGEPMDKAGAYGIQGFGSRYVLGIVGDYFTVMGLPVQMLYAQLSDLCAEGLQLSGE